MVCLCRRPGPPLDYTAMSEKWDIDFEAHFVDPLVRPDEAFEDDLMVSTVRGFDVTERGRLFIRNLGLCFDAYLEPVVEGRYSKTV